MASVASTIGAILRFQLVRNVRVQFYAAIVLTGYGLYTALHVPQGFYDHVLRCLSLLMASICCLHVLLENHRLSLPERMVLIPFAVLLALATLVSLDAAFHVKGFSNR